MALVCKVPTLCLRGDYSRRTHGRPLSFHKAREWVACSHASSREWGSWVFRALCATSSSSVLHPQAAAPARQLMHHRATPQLQRHQSWVAHLPLPLPLLSHSGGSSLCRCLRSHAATAMAVGPATRRQQNQRGPRPLNRRHQTGMCRTTNLMTRLRRNQVPVRAAKPNPALARPPIAATERCHAAAALFTSPTTSASPALGTGDGTCVGSRVGKGLGTRVGAAVGTGLG